MAPALWSTPANSLLSARAGPPARATASRGVFAQPVQARSTRRRCVHRQHTHRPGGYAQLHRALSRQEPGVIVLATHYETNYPLRNINFVGANDGGSTTGLLLAIATSCATNS